MPSTRSGWWLPTALSLALGLLTFVVVATTAPAPAFAQKKQSAKALIKKGQDQFDEQLYEESIQTLSAALMRPGIAKKEKIRVYQLLAYNYIVLQRDEEADGAVRGLLVLDPKYALPETESPRFRDFFEKTRETWNDEGRPGLEVDGPDTTAKPVVIKHTAPAQVSSGLTVSLDGKIDDPDAVVDKVILFYRAGTEGKFEQKRVNFAMRKFTVDIPGDAVEPPLVEYYIQAVDTDGLPVATRGDVENPLRIAVPEEGGASVVESPWLWVPVSLAVVAAVVIPIVIVSTQQRDSTVTVNVFDP